MSQSLTSPKPFCFVLMPFSPAFTDIYEFGIKGACADAGAYCERVDEQVFLGSMLDRIYNQISRADIIVADMTGKNPNVFYEVGYAHALGKTTVLLTQSADDIPFDLKHFPHIVYQQHIKELRTELARRIEHLLKHNAEPSQTQLGLELFAGRESLAAGDTFRTYPAESLPSITITVFNGSTLTYKPGEFRLAVIAPDPFRFSWFENVSVTELPDGTYLHTLPEFETLFPGAYASIEIGLRHFSDVTAPSDFQILFRVFSPAGYRDFPLRLRTDA
jgi:hypothetical protein